MLPRSVRVSETEHELVKLAADEAGAPSVSAWMRRALKRQALRELAGEPSQGPKELYEREEERLAREGVTA